MHGREGEEEEEGSIHRRVVRVNRHMWPVPTRVAAIGPSSDIGDGSYFSSSSSSPTYFCKDGRRITIGDCALFKPPQNSQPFIGIIRWLTSGKDNSSKLVVSWLYRPADIKLGKGILLEAAPNEVFYSFHKDEIPAASLLHPCKVAFLPQGVELPSGISSYICRRVYDITSKHLWWLTDKDYINERQEEVDQLLYKTRIEMHGATVQPGCRSPKPMSGPMSTSHTKPSPDSVHNTAFPSSQSQSRGKKRERGDQGSEPLKRERSSRLEDGDLGHGRMESFLKSEIAKITERGGGLVGLEGVEKLLQLMLPDKGEKKVDLASRSMLVGVIAATEKVDCLNRFVQLKGLPVLDEWLQEVHKGKVGDVTGLKDNEKPVEDFLLVLLGALDKLPVNLEALQMCNIGKSVNHLRTQKNMEIQKKARSLVDTWKKGVEAEMAINDAKSGSNQSVPWSSRSRLTEACHAGSRQSGGTSETALKSTTTQLSVSRTASGRLVHGESASKSGAASAGIGKSALSPASTGASCKDGQSRNVVVSGGDIPLTTSRDDKSSSSSQSHNNSQSCSSDHAKTGALSGKDDARSSTAGSNKISGSSSRHRKATNGFPVSAASGVQKDAVSSRNSSSHRNVTIDKLSHWVSVFEKEVDMAVEASSHKLIVKIPNRGRSPVHCASAGSFEDPANLNSRASSPVPSDRPDHFECGQKETADASRAKISNDAITNTESWQSNDFKDALTGSDDGNGSPVAVPDNERGGSHRDTKRAMGASKASSISPSKEIKSSKFHDVSHSSINALINCVTYSEVDAQSGDNMGMNLLASVATGEIPKSNCVSPNVSPEGNTAAPDSSCTGHDPAVVSSLENRSLQDHCHSNNGLDERVDRVDVSSGAVQCSKGSSIYRFPSSEEKVVSEHNRLVNPCSLELQQASEACHLSEGNGAKTPTPPTGCYEKTASGEEKTTGTAKDHTQQTTAIVGVNADESFKAKDCPWLLPENKNDSVILSGEGGAQTTEELSSAAVKQQKETGGASNGGMSAEESTAIIAPSKEAKAEELVLETINNAAGEEAMETLNRISDNSQANSVSGDDRKTEGIEDNEDIKATSELLDEIPGKVKPDFLVKETENARYSRCKMPGSKVEGMEEAASAVDNSSVSAFEVLRADVRIKFDLNEGLNADDEKVCEPGMNLPTPACTAAVPLIGQLPFPASTSNKLPAPIAVAAAAKGLFVPPDDLLRSKAELGWKGSAATSAFRPAEPRKTQEISGMTNSLQSSDTALAKHSRLLLDIDLNVADERIDEDITAQSSTPDTALPAIRSDLASVRGSGGLDLDLNQVDVPDVENCTASDRSQPDVSIVPVKSIPGNVPNGEGVGACRDFDLNDGPLLDELCAEQSAVSHHRSNFAFQPPVTGHRPNNAEVGNLSSWLSTGSNYSAIPTPLNLSNRGEPSFSLVATSHPPRILGPSTSGSPFTPDVYRGPVMTSSAIPFPSTFQYPGFSFGTSYPLPSVAFSSSSNTYVDPSSGSRLYFPTVQSQVLGPTGAVSSNYMRPYVNLSDGNRNSGVDSNKNWSRHGLDLNSGPAGLDVEKDELLPLTTRQIPVASSQTTAEEQARFYHASNGILKRREPECGWDIYKHASWQ